MFQDTYHNLTLKTIMGLKWMAIFCPQAEFVLKTDDDIYVNVDLLHRSLLVESETLSQNIHGKYANTKYIVVYRSSPYLFSHFVEDDFNGVICRSVEKLSNVINESPLKTLLN